MYVRFVLRFGSVERYFQEYRDYREYLLTLCSDGQDVLEVIDINTGKKPIVPVL